MNVRELITELLEYHPDQNVSVNLILNDDVQQESFTIREDILHDVVLEVRLEDEILLDAREFDELEEDSQTLERMIQEQEAEK